MGAAGLVTLGTINLLHVLPPEPRGLIAPLGLAIVYAVLANLCYSAGWTVDLLVQRLWGADVKPVGPALFRQGLVFSVGLTLLPCIMAGLDYLWRVFRAFL